MRKWSQRLFVPNPIAGKWLRVLGVLAVMGLLLVALSKEMFSIFPVRANTLIASDSFNRTVSNGWGTADLGGWWTVVGSPWAWTVSPGAGSVTVGANSEEQAYLSSFTIQNVDIVEKVMLPRCSGSSNCDAYVLGRYAPAYSPTYYRVGVMQGAGRADIFLHAQRSDGTNLGRDLDTGLPAANNAVVWLHVQFQGANPTTLRARVWLDGTTEPSTWLLNTTDNNSAEQQACSCAMKIPAPSTPSSSRVIRPPGLPFPSTSHTIRAAPARASAWVVSPVSRRHSGSPRPGIARVGP